MLTRAVHRTLQITRTSAALTPPPALLSAPLKPFQTSSIFNFANRARPPHAPAPRPLTAHHPHHPTSTTQRTSTRPNRTPLRASLCMSTKRPMVRIGTHNGTFHCDEALGCFLLRHTQQFRDADIVRSRDPAVLKDLDVVIDVGGTYDPTSHRYDHHQRDFDVRFAPGDFTCTKMSSAGLVYRHFGREVVSKMLGMSQDDPQLELLYNRMYKLFIESVDATDNGVMPFDTTDPPKYVNPTTLQARVSALNPDWNEDADEQSYNERFMKAVNLTGEEFCDKLQWMARSWLPARQYVEAALRERFTVDGSGQIIRLPRACPWKEHLYGLEAAEGVAQPILFCLYEDMEKKWRVQAVSVGPGSFTNRKSMPKAWCGVRDAALSELSGIPGCIFVHANGFIGGNATFEGALEMARKSLAME